MGKKVLYVANVGDTRGVMMSGANTFQRVSYDHKATDKQEIDRVKKDGGIIMDERVGGALAITRAFGDYALKRDGVTAKPSITKHFLKPADKFLVIASDGIWDVLEDEDTCKLCRDEISSKEIG
jgi:protein phosphatase PTC1